MSTGRLGMAVLGVVIVLVYAGGSALWVQTDSAWWNSLNRPSWQPPDIVFGLIWPYHFTVLGFAMVFIAQRLSEWQIRTAIGIFALSVVAALAWSYLFYVPHQLGWSTVALAVAAVLTAPVLWFTFQASFVTGLLLVPYQIWICIATSLAWGYAHLN